MTLGQLNALSVSAAAEELSRCCASSRWVELMIARRPFHSMEEVFAAAEETGKELSESDWKEAFTHHPKIGDIENIRKKFAATEQWASGEQAGVRTATEEVLRDLADGNRDYEQKFGYTFIVCATGKSAQEMLDILKERLKNRLSAEITSAAAEQMKITRIRLNKLLDDRFH